MKRILILNEVYPVVADLYFQLLLNSEETIK